MDPAVAASVAGAVRSLLAAGGEPVTYKPAGGTPKTVQALIRRGVYENEETDSGLYWLKRAELTIMSDATDGIADPHYDDQVAFDGGDWEVVTIQPDGIASYRIDVERRELVSVKRRR